MSFLYSGPVCVPYFYVLICILSGVSDEKNVVNLLTIFFLNEGADSKVATLVSLSSAYGKKIVQDVAYTSLTYKLAVQLDGFGVIDVLSAQQVWRTFTYSSPPCRCF